ncbi:DUF5110 domain-containing protein [Streptomyces collinus]|uniref:DUF5110 domain-containing protein n=1 Tax=Streptomyces collinus TaxID=42684 RepID=UPI0033289FAD
MPGDARGEQGGLTLTVAAGGSGTLSLYDDDGSSTVSKRATTVRARYCEQASSGRLTIGAARGTFVGQADRRQWTVRFLGVRQAPKAVTASGRPLPASAWSWDGDRHTLRVTLPARSTQEAVTMSWRSA